MEEINNTIQKFDNVIVIDDGRIDVPIRNQFGETIGIFRFNPTDVNIVNRYNEAAEKFEEIAKPLVNIDISGTGEGDTPQAVDALNDAEDRLTDLLDYVLGGNSREAFFSKIHAFTPTGGHFFCELVFNAVGSYIEKAFESETKKISVRMKQHMQGYKPGSRRRG